MRFDRGRTAFASLLVGAAMALGACGEEDEGAVQGSAASQGDGAPAQKVRVGFAVANLFETLPFKVAKEQGFFEKQGLEVEFVDFQASSQAYSALLGGDVELDSAGGTDIASLVAKDAPVVGLGGIYPNGPYYVMIAGADSGVDRPEDMCGKNWGITAFGSNTETVVKQYAKSLGCDIKPVPLGGLTSQTAALKKGSIAGFVWTTQVGLLLESDGVGKIVADYKDIHPHDQYLMLIARQDYVEQNGETVQKFMTALGCATQYFQDNPEWATQFAAQQLDVPEEVAAKIHDVEAPFFDPMIGVDEEGLEVLAKQVVELDIAPQEPAVEDMYTTDHRPQLDQCG